MTTRLKAILSGGILMAAALLFVGSKRQSPSDRVRRAVA